MSDERLGEENVEEVKEVQENASETDVTTDEAPQENIENSPEEVEAEVTQVPEEAVQVIAESTGETVTLQNPFKKIPTRALAIGGAVVAFLLLIILAIGLASGGASTNNSLVYVKDNELHHIFLNQLKPFEISNNRAGEDVGYLINMSKDGKRIFYHVYDNYANSYNLYTREVGNKKADSLRIATDTVEYQVSDNGKWIYYTKGSDGRLFVDEVGKDKAERIASDVSSFYIDPTGRKVIWVNEDGDIYYKDGKKDPVKQDSDARISRVDENLKKIYYTKDDILYVKEIGKDKVKISSDVERVLNIYDTGEIYYTVESEGEFSFVDDMQAEDESFVMPEYPRYADTQWTPYPPNEPEDPKVRYADRYSDDYYKNFFTGEVDEERKKAGLEELAELEKAYKEEFENYKKELKKHEEEVADIEAANKAEEERYEREMGEYNRAQERQEEINYRDRIREYIHGVEGGMTTKELVYYNGKTSKTIFNNFHSAYTSHQEKPIAVFEGINDEEGESIKMSDFTSYSDWLDLIENSDYSEKYMYVATGDSVVQLDAVNSGEVIGIKINNSGDRIYYILGSSEEAGGNLMEVAFNSKEGEKPKVYQENVDSFKFFEDSDEIYTFRDVVSGTGELVINGKSIDYDVEINTVYRAPDKKELFYLTEVDSKYRGTLKSSSSKKSTKIADDVSIFIPLGGGRVALLKDVSSRGRGDLYLSKGGKLTKKIDDDVTSILRITSNNW